MGLTDILVKMALKKYDKEINIAAKDVNKKYKEFIKKELEKNGGSNLGNEDMKSRLDKFNKKVEKNKDHESKSKKREVKNKNVKKKKQPFAKNKRK